VPQNKHGIGEVYKTPIFETKMDVRLYQTYIEGDNVVISWDNKQDLTRYFTKEMSIEQFIYHYKHFTT
jgi:hypothetical protein